MTTCFFPVSSLFLPCLFLEPPLLSATSSSSGARLCGPVRVSSKSSSRSSLACFSNDSPRARLEPQNLQKHLSVTLRLMLSVVYSYVNFPTAVVGCAPQVVELVNCWICIEKLPIEICLWLPGLLAQLPLMTWWYSAIFKIIQRFDVDEMVRSRFANFSWRCSERDEVHSWFQDGLYWGVSSWWPAISNGKTEGWLV